MFGACISMVFGRGCARFGVYEFIPWRERTGCYVGEKRREDDSAKYLSREYSVKIMPNHAFTSNLDYYSTMMNFATKPILDSLLSQKKVHSYSDRKFELTRKWTIFRMDNWHLACYWFSWISCQWWCNTCHLLHIICSYSWSGIKQYPEALMHNVSPATAWITYRVNP